MKENGNINEEKYDRYWRRNMMKMTQWLMYDEWENDSTE